MCGIAGVLDRSGRWVEQPELLRDDGLDARIAGPTTRAGTRGTASGSATAGSRSSTLGSAATSRWRTRTARSGRLQRRDLQLPRAARASSRRAGHRFRSRSDTEVVVHAYEEWGARLPRAASTACSRSRSGTQRQRRARSLRATASASSRSTDASTTAGFVFGSEVKVAARGRLPRARRSPQALVEYFTFQNIFSDRDAVRRACTCSRPAALLAADADGVQRRERYWDLRVRAGRDRARWRTGVGEVREALEAAVDAAARQRRAGRQLPLGRPGLGSIVARRDRQRCAAPDDVHGRLRPHVRRRASSWSSTSARRPRRSRACFRTEHYEMVMHAGDMAWALPELIWHLEDLRVGMCYQNHYIARLASKFVKVALAGAGGDELFARLSVALRAASRTLHDRRGVRPRATTTTGAGSCRGRARLLLHRRDVGGGAAASTPFDVFRDALAPARELDPYSQGALLRGEDFLHGLLVVEDRVSMAHSLEARVPFLDNELVELAGRIPSQLQCTRTARASAVLRAAMRGLLPDGDRARKRKQGFSPPDESWYRGPTMDYIRAMLLDRRSLDRAAASSRLRCGGCHRAHRGPRQPPAADLVAALLRVVEPASSWTASCRRR